MLHILLLILKIIGIIIAVILGILLLLILILLFVPVRYKAQGVCRGTTDSLKGKVCITWLLHLFRIDLLYKDSHLIWKLRIVFWKRRSAKKRSAEIKEEKADEKDDEKERSVNEEPDTAVEETDETHEEPEKKRSVEAYEEPEVEEELQVAEKAQDVKRLPQTVQCEEDKEKSGQISEDPEKTEKKKSKRKNPDKKESYIQRIVKKIKRTRDKMREQKQTVVDKKEQLMSFHSLLTIRNGVSSILGSIFFGASIQFLISRRIEKAKKELFRFLKAWKPKKLEGKIRFGFEDPAYTGEVLAVLSVFYPLFGSAFEVHPDFEQAVFGGSLLCKGNLRLNHLARLAWVLFWNRNIRTTYRDIKNYER